MRGHKDAIEWDEDREKFFLELLSDRIRKAPNRSLIFKGTEWTEMDDEIYIKFGLRYGEHKLKGKYHRLRSMHTKFYELINNTGVTWDSVSGKVLANDTVWNDFIMRDKVYKTFKKNGCKLFPLLSAVFSSSTASRTFHNASTSPQKSNEELNLEGGEAHSAESASKRRKSDGENNSRNDKFEALLDTWSDILMARKERDLAIAAKYKALLREVATSVTEEASIIDCMAVLEATPDVSTTSYNKALEYFLKVDWRKIFLLMSKDRRKAWLDHLDDMTKEASIIDCMAVLEATPDVSTTSYNKALEYFLKVDWRKLFLLMSKDMRKAWLDHLDDRTSNIK